MAKEIERKFLVNSGFEEYVESRHTISQGYLNNDPDRTVRVRLFDNKGFITVKTRNKGCVRNEWEYEIPAADAKALLEVCLSRIDKTRCLINGGNGLTWEVDVFSGAHEGLVVAEIELPSPESAFTRPSWLGEEVTGDSRYYNSSLASKESEE